MRARAAEPQANSPEFTVSELSTALKRTVEDAYGHVRVRGEISGFRGPHSSGHCYFALKDESAKIEAVVWKGSYGKMRFKPQEGLEVIATGKLTTYPGSSKYQIVIESLEPAGIGALMALMEERKRKLGAEGLFDEARKQLLPWLPEVIGVITSPTGAVIRDILHRLADRFPRHVLLWPVKVQGEGSADQVAAAIRGFNALPEDGAIPRPDLIIVARGGGSLEDLWSFNEENVVRAAAESMIPLISAVGHETDVTLIDFAADKRAPTPTAAAEMAVPVRSELIGEIDSIARRMRLCWTRGIENRRSELRAAARALPQPGELLAIPRQRLDAAAAKLPRALMANTHAHERRYTRLAARLAPRVLSGQLMQGRQRVAGAGERLTLAARALLTRQRTRLNSGGQLLAALSYRGVLARGFALVRDAEGNAVHAAAAVAPGAALSLEFSDGRIAATAEGGAPGEAPRPAPKRAKRVEQGTLFLDPALHSRSRLDRAGVLFRSADAGARRQTLLNKFGPSGSGEAKLQYLDGDFRVVSPGTYVRCAISNEHIPLDELKYWSVDRQEAYATPTAVLTRHFPTVFKAKA